jgi:hypothetical protein
LSTSSILPRVDFGSFEEEDGSEEDDEDATDEEETLNNSEKDKADDDNTREPAIFKKEVAWRQSATAWAIPDFFEILKDQYRGVAVDSYQPARGVGCVVDLCSRRPGYGTYAAGYLPSAQLARSRSIL